MSNTVSSVVTPFRARKKFYFHFYFLTLPKARIFLTINYEFCKGQDKEMKYSLKNSHGFSSFCS